MTSARFEKNWHDFDKNIYGKLEPFYSVTSSTVHG